VLFPNGAQFLAPWKGVEPLGEGYVEKSIVDNLGNAAPDCIEGWCDVPTTTLLGVPRFGIPRFTIEESCLVVTVELIGGDAGFWSAATPQLFNDAVNLGGSIMAPSPPPLMNREHVEVPVRYGRSTSVGRTVYGQGDQDGFLVATCEVNTLIHSSPGVASFSAKLFESPAPHRADGLIQRGEDPFNVFMPASPH